MEPVPNSSAPNAQPESKGSQPSPVVKAQPVEFWTWSRVLMLWAMAICWFFLMERCITWADLLIDWLGYPREPSSWMNARVGNVIRAASRAVIRVMQGLGLFYLLALPVRRTLARAQPRKWLGPFPAYHTAFRFVAKSTFPSDAEPEAGGFGSWRDIRKWFTFLGYYSGVISLPTTRRLFYVTFNPFRTHRRKPFDLTQAAHRSKSLFPVPKRVVEKTRIYIETELFPRDKGEMETLKTDKPDEYGEKIAEQYLENLKEFDEGEVVLECESCFDFFGNNSDAIRNYFQAQEELQDDLDGPPCFLSKISVKVGYLSPTYLISGPLDEFDEDWTRIVRGYNDKMTAMSRDDPLNGSHRLQELRKLQSFIWDCWVQWGPSVPICAHPDWTSGCVALQFGYGDENNSLPLIMKKPSSEGQTHFDWSDWNADDCPLKKLKSGLGWAWPVKVIGRLKWYRREERQQRFCKAQQFRESAVSPSDDKDNGWMVFEADSIERDAGPPLYYSAYVWVLIAMCREERDPTTQKARYRLIHPGEEERWRCLIPFFQHGNVAEACVFDDIKRELAYKTIDTLIEQLRRTRADRGEWLHFTFVAAYDDNGDQASLLVNTPGMKTVPATSHDRGEVTPLPASTPEMKAIQTASDDSGHAASLPASTPVKKTIQQWLVQALRERVPQPGTPGAEELTQILNHIHVDRDAFTEFCASDLPQIVRAYLNQLPAASA